MAAVPTYDPETGSWVQQDQGNVPVTGDSGISYSSSVYDILNKGVGVLLTGAATGAVDYTAGALNGFEDKNRYESAGGVTFKQGQPAQGATAQGSTTVAGLKTAQLMMLGAGALLIYLLFFHHG